MLFGLWQRRGIFKGRVQLFSEGIKSWVLPRMNWSCMRVE